MTGKRKYIWTATGFVDVTDMPRRRAPGPYIIRDTMQACVHPVTGETFDSKSAFRAITKAHGMEELGNDAPLSAPAYEPAGVKADIAEAIDKLEQGWTAPPSEDADLGAELRVFE